MCRWDMWRIPLYILSLADSTDVSTPIWTPSHDGISCILGELILIPLLKLCHWETWGFHRISYTYLILALSWIISKVTKLWAFPHFPHVILWPPLKFFYPPLSTLPNPQIWDWFWALWTEMALIFSSMWGHIWSILLGEKIGITVWKLTGASSY